MRLGVFLVHVLLDIVTANRVLRGTTVGYYYAMFVSGTAYVVTEKVGVT